MWLPEKAQATTQRLNDTINDTEIHFEKSIDHGKGHIILHLHKFCFHGRSEFFDKIMMFGQ